MENNSISQKISDLFDLYKEGFITKEEYETLKSQELAKISKRKTTEKDIDESGSGSSSQNDNKNETINIFEQKSLFEEKIKSDPSNINLLIEYVNFLIVNDLEDEAIKVITKIEEIGGNNLIAKKLLFDAYITKEKYDEAKLLGESIYNINPQDVALIDRLVHVCKELNDWENVISFCDKALSIEPNNKTFIRDKGFALLKLNSIDLASEHYNKLYFEGTEDILVNIYSGVWNALNEDYKTAKNILQKVVKIEKSKQKDININRGLLYLLFSKIQDENYSPEFLLIYNIIDFNVLQENQNATDEQVLIRIFDYLTTEGFRKNTSKKQLNKWVKQLPKLEYFNENYELTANLWKTIGKKQLELNLYKDSSNSFKKAQKFIPENKEFKFYQKHAEEKYKAQKRIWALLKVTSFLVLIFMIFAFVFMPIRRQQQEKSLYEKVIAENTYEDYRDFLNQYPTGKFYDEIYNKSDELYWNMATTKNNVDAYNEYLKEFPDGSYAIESKNKIDELIWTEYKEIGTKESYQNYLSKYKNGRYKSEAKTLLKNIEIFNGFNEDKAKQQILNDIATYRLWHEDYCFDYGDIPEKHVVSNFKKIQFLDELAYVAIVYSPNSDWYMRCASLSLYEFRYKNNSWQPERSFKIFTTIMRNEIDSISFDVLKISSFNYAIVHEESFNRGVNYYGESAAFYIPYNGSVNFVLNIQSEEEERSLDGDIVEGFTADIVIKEEGNSYYPIEVNYTYLNGRKRKEIYKFNNGEYVKTSNN